MGPVPKNVVFLTADAFGVLPPIARLTPEQAMYHFLSGYTAKVAGTEIGVTEPEATFSTCFGAPFMPRFPWVYGNLLKERIAKGGVKCWLVNTGWTGGKYGAGSRMPIKATRALLNAALDGSLNDVEFRTDPNFGVEVPVSVPGVDSAILNPRDTWADKADYDATAARLVTLFTDNFAKFADHVDAAVLRARRRAWAASKRKPQQAPETVDHGLTPSFSSCLSKGACRRGPARSLLLFKGHEHDRPRTETLAERRRDPPRRRGLPRPHPAKARLDPRGPYLDDLLAASSNARTSRPSATCPTSSAATTKASAA